MRTCALLLIAGILGANPAAAQSLADVAKKEVERRERVKESGKSYTNKDLKPAPAPAAADSDATANPDAKSTAASGSGTTEKEKGAAGAGAQGTKSDSEKPPVRDKAYWSKRMTDLHEQLDRDLVYMDALQSRINALTTDFVNRDDPVQRGQVAADRQRALDELARLKKGTEQDKKAISDLEEEARRAGVPPGWLR